MARLSLRVDLGAAGAIGPGKMRLLETIAATGSISAAGRALGMSYRRAWSLVDEMNACFRQPVVSVAIGGKAGGGATLTALGREVVRRYRSLETRAATAAAADLAALQRQTVTPADETA
jgi:molybdate transport system regulatory protein